MSRFDVFARLAHYLGQHGDPTVSGRLANPGLTRKQLRKLRPPRYKPAFSCGYRGWPKTTTPCGSIPAPTMDQVRDRERYFGLKIHVKNGLMFFASDGRMWTRDEATKRQEAAYGS